MKMIKFTKAFDIRLSAMSGRHFSAGSVRKLPEAQAAAALAAGVAEEVDATDEVIVDDTPQLAPVIRGETSAAVAARLKASVARRPPPPAPDDETADHSDA